MMMKVFLFFIKIGLLSIFFTVAVEWGDFNEALAQNRRVRKQRTKTKSVKDKRTSVNFEDELIQGDIKTPELIHLLRKKQFNYKRLLKLRDNFLLEMESDASVVK